MQLQITLLIWPQKFPKPAMAKRLFYLDGNNIGCWLDNKNIKQEKPKEKNKISDDEKPEIRMAILLTLCNELIKRGDNFICFFDANIQYIIKEKEFETVLFRFLDNKEKCKIVPGQSQADSFILPLANREKASVISNDIFKHSIKKYPWLKKNAKPQRLFKGMATETSLKEAKLLIPDLDIEIPIETDIPKLLRELGVSKSDPGGGGDGNEEDEETGTGDTEQKRIEEKRRKKEEEERKRQAEIKRLEEQKRKEEEERRKQEEEKKRREEQEKRKLLFIFAFIFLIVILFYNLSSNSFNRFSENACTAFLRSKSLPSSRFCAIILTTRVSVILTSASVVSRTVAPSYIFSSPLITGTSGIISSALNSNTSCKESVTSRIPITQE